MAFGESEFFQLLSEAWPIRPAPNDARLQLKASWVKRCQKMFVERKRVFCWFSSRLCNCFEVVLGFDSGFDHVCLESFFDIMGMVLSFASGFILSFIFYTTTASIGLACSYTYPFSKNLLKTCSKRHPISLLFFVPHTNTLKKI